MPEKPPAQSYVISGGNTTSLCLLINVSGDLLSVAEVSLLPGFGTAGYMWLLPDTTGYEQCPIRLKKLVLILDGGIRRLT